MVNSLIFLQTLFGRTAVGWRGAALYRPVKDMPEKFVAVVEPNRVGAQQPPHSFHRMRLRRFCHEMKMVSHQTIGMNLPGSFRASFGQSFQEIVSVNVRQKDVFATIPAAHQVVSGA
jgi:hypothetical protein